LTTDEEKIPAAAAAAAAAASAASRGLIEANAHHVVAELIAMIRANI